MPRKIEKTNTFHVPWYTLSANKLVATLGSLKKEVNCDICVIGAGFTGLSAALELTKKGYSVVLIEKETIAASASGRNGGQLQRGYPKSPQVLIERFGFDDAKMMSDITLEGIQLITRRIEKHDIRCDLKYGQLTAALDKSQLKSLEEEAAGWRKFGHDDLKMLSRDQTLNMVKAQPYIGGLFDPKGAHFHPLNYALGLAQAAQKDGCRIYDYTRALKIEHGAAPTVVTEHGKVRAKFVILAGAIQLKGSETMVKKSITAAAHMIATEPLGERRARNIMQQDIAVCDARFIMDYYRFSADYRILFGGNCNYSDMDYPGEPERLRQRMLKLFPALFATGIDHCWRGPLEFTINRMPELGRLSPTVYFAHGFGGQGVVATNILGKVLAEAVSGQAERFDVFERIKHRPFVGGQGLKRPLFVLGMTWFKLRDKLGA